MIRDILTVMWKDRREQANQDQRLRDRIVGLMLPVMCMGTMAIYPAIAMGPAWVTSPLVLVISFLIPTMIVGMGIVDAFAGERERHTLESLLATRLPDRAILFGKIAGPVVLALQFTVYLHLASLVALNIVHWEGMVLVYPLRMVAAILSLAILTSLFASSLGVLISLRAQTLRLAAQRLMTAVLAPIIVVCFGVGLIGRAAPASWREAFESCVIQHIATLSFAQGTLAVLAFLAVADAALLLAATLRFRRNRLVVG